MRTLVGGIGYGNLSDYSTGGVIVDRLSARPWPPHVVLEDVSYNPIAFVQRLQEETAERAFERAIIAGSMSRPGRPSGTVTAYRWDGVLPEPAAIQAAVAEALTGVISLDNTLIIAKQFNALPREVIVIEIQPEAHAFGGELTGAVAGAVDRACEMVTSLTFDEGASRRLAERPLGGGTVQIR